MEQLSSNGMDLYNQPMYRFHSFQEFKPRTIKTLFNTSKENTCYLLSFLQLISMILISDLGLIKPGVLSQIQIILI